MELGNEISNKIRSAIKAKLTELGAYVDDELPDYIMVMVANKKDRDHMHKDLGLFLGPHSEVFTGWLFGVLDRLKSLAVDETGQYLAANNVIDKAAADIRSSVPPLLIASTTSSIALVSQSDAVAISSPIKTDVTIASVNEAKKLPISETVKSSSNEKRHDVHAVVDRSDSRRRSNNRDNNSSGDNDKERHKERDRSSRRDRDNRERYRDERHDDKSYYRGRDRGDKERKDREESRHHSSRSEYRERDRNRDHARSVDKDPSELKKLRPRVEEDNDPLGVKSKDTTDNASSLSSTVVRVSKAPHRTLSSATESAANSGSGTVEANRSLLMRAMHEAEQSVAVTKSTGGHLAADDLRRSKLGSLRDRLGERVDSSEEEHRASDTRFIVTLKGADRLRKRTAIKSLAPPPTPLSPMIVLDDVDDDLEELLIVSPPIIPSAASKEVSDDYTLEGAMDSVQLLSEPQQLQMPTNGNGRYRIQLNDDSDSEFESSPMKRPRLTVAMPLDELASGATSGELNTSPDAAMGPNTGKLRERCRYWPDCRFAADCTYWHPQEPCRTFPACRFGDACLFQHPMCKFDALCTRTGCPYSHSISLGATSSRITMRPTMPGALAASCPPPFISAVNGVTRLMRSGVVPFLPTSSAVSGPVGPTKCRFYPKCTNMECRFFHPRSMCRYGSACSRKEICRFGHPEIPDRKSLKWVKNDKSITQTEEEVLAKPNPIVVL